MNRVSMCNTVGVSYLTSNIEGGEYSYVKEAGGKEELEKALGHPLGKHYKLDIRFEDKETGVVVLIETKQEFIKADEAQLEEYLEEEHALHRANKVICILANTNDDKIKVWQNVMDDNHVLKEETAIDTMEHYIDLFKMNKSNDRIRVLSNTYALNVLLHKKDIDERLRSQFVGTVLLHVKKLVNQFGITYIGTEAVKRVNNYLDQLDGRTIRSAIGSTLNDLLNGSDNKAKKIELLKKNVLDDQKVKRLKVKDWKEIFDTILTDIYRYIDAETSEGQDILNLFFIAFNKYTGKADKNQAFTPDHITEFMCRLTDVDWNKRVLDATCGSGSFLVQALVKELANVRSLPKTEEQKNDCIATVKRERIYGIEIEEKAYGLSITNMLIHSDGNSNIKFGSCFDSEDFIREANPDIILMNPPYNAKPITIPDKYKDSWGKAKNGKEDPTKGLIFIHYLSDIIEKMNEERLKNNQPIKLVKLAVLLPLAAAIGTSQIVEDEKKYLLKNNTLDAVFSLPQDMFYPGAAVNACCMIFIMGQPHIKADGTSRATFFGYCRDDGFIKRKGLGRVEQFYPDGTSVWKKIESEWLSLYENRQAVDGKSAVATVGSKDEWLCEAYMKTDYSKLSSSDFQQTINNYLSYLVKEGKVVEEN